MFCAEKARRRYVSEDLHTRARRFGTPVSVALTRHPETARHQLEVVVHTQYFKPKAAPLVIVIELRKLFFWLALMLVVASAGAFRAMPGGPVPRPATSHLHRTGVEATPAVSSQIGAFDRPEQEKLFKPASASTVISPLMEEAALRMGQAGADSFGADSYDVAAASHQMLSLLANGEFTFAQLKVYFSRACLSALMHKVVGTGVTLASCMVHHPGVLH